MKEEQKFRDLSDREIKVKQLQIDMHEDMIVNKQTEIDRLLREIKMDIPNNKHRMEVRKMNADIELYNEVISNWKKEIREKKEKIKEK